MAACAQCNKGLVLEIDDSDDDGAVGTAGSSCQDAKTVPDDVQLPCGCHFHWQCLLDAYEVATCPSCSRQVSTSSTESEQLLVTLHNEGGLQHDLDILPLLTEESYLRAYPEERKSRAFLEFCREGDHRAVVDLLRSCAEEDGDGEAFDSDIDVDELDNAAPVAQKSPHEILRYQDPIGGMQSGLHAAVANGHREVAWLLLLLASELPEMDFPALVFQEAASLGVMREGQSGKVDIRSLRDAEGRTAESIAREEGVLWTGWVDNGRLAVS